MGRNNIQILLKTLFFGQFVGCDEFNNKYYQDKRTKKNSKRYNRRWVLYAYKAEASCIPATWHGWLHYSCNKPLSRTKNPVTINQQINKTGTRDAYFPPNFDRGGYIQKNNVKHYQSWQPCKK